MEKAKMDTFAKVQQIMADLFNQSPDEVKLSSSPDSIDIWDSMQNLNIVIALEQEFGVQFDPEDIERMKTVELIVLIVDEKLQHSSPGSR